MIVYTGATGSIGSDMPTGCISLTTRLEASLDEMCAELVDKTKGAEFSFIHLAGLVQVADCEKNPAKAKTLNVDGSLKWCRAFSQVSPKGRFVFASTGHVYAPSSSKLTPLSPVAPRSAYAKSKYEAELALKALCETKKTPLTIARIFSVWPRVLKPGYLITSLHERAQKKDFSPIPGLSNTRDFLTSQEICAELCRLTEDKEAPNYKVINICSGKGTTIADVVKTVFRQYGLNEIPPESPARPTDIKYLVGEKP